MLKTNSGHISLLQEFKQHNYFWVNAAESQVRYIIKYYAVSLLAEAKSCNCVRLLDENEMYRQFKENSNNEEEYANKYICKFFNVKMYIKALFWTLGEWKFTEQDKEMFKYFHEHKSKIGLNRKNFVFKFANHCDMSCGMNVLLKLHTRYEAFGKLSNVDFKFNKCSYVYDYNPFKDLSVMFAVIDELLLGFDEYDKLINMLYNWTMYSTDAIEIHDLDETHLFSTLKNITNNALTYVTSYFK